MIDLNAVRAPHALQEVPAVEPKLVKLDLGCGDNKQPDHIGVDFVKTPSADVVHDLFTFPWPFDDASVDHITANHFFEHVPARLRFQFMDEVWRILKPGGKAHFVTPYYTSSRAVQDPTHEWPPICEASYLYFNRLWREQNKLTHYPVKCNFDFQIGLTIAADIIPRNEEYRAFAFKHFVNAADDLIITLEKKD